jgi:hypothetical protein
MKVGFKIWGNEFPVIEGDPLDVSFWTRAKNGLASIFGGKSLTTYLKTWLRFRQLQDKGRDASREQLGEGDLRAKRYFKDFLHFGQSAK